MLWQYGEENAVEQMPDYGVAGERCISMPFRPHEAPQNRLKNPAAASRPSRHRDDGHAGPSPQPESITQMARRQPRARPAIVAHRRRRVGGRAHLVTRAEIRLHVDFNRLALVAMLGEFS